MQEHEIQQDAVLLRTGVEPGQIDADAFAKSLETFGFSGVVTNNRHFPHTNRVVLAEALPNELEISSSLQSVAEGGMQTSDELWKTHEAASISAAYSTLHLTSANLDGQGAVALMAQMSLPHIPIVAFNRLPQDLPRNQAHYVRSLIFWRNRNRIATMRPRLVHAGNDGTIVYILGSWLVALNWNDDEISIDIGDSGSMWLMLGTPRDVQLQGSLLVLPAYSGAILANELAM